MAADYRPHRWRRENGQPGRLFDTDPEETHSVQSVSAYHAGNDPQKRSCVAQVGPWESMEEKKIGGVGTSPEANLEPLQVLRAVSRRVPLNREPRRASQRVRQSRLMIRSMCR